MKSKYDLYGHESSHLEERLSENDIKILNSFMCYCSTTAGPNKVKDYRRYMLQFRDVIEKPYDQITKEDAVSFWALLNHSSHEMQTKKTIKSTVKRFLRWHYKDLEMMELLKGTKCEIVNPRRVNKMTLFKKSELDMMLHAAERIRDKALLMLLMETAARPQEIRDLKWCDINWQEREVHLYSTKTGRDRDLPINLSYDFLVEWHKNWIYPDPQGEDYIFPAMARARQPRQKPISTSYINRIVKGLAKRSNIQRKVNTYLLRHSRLTEIYTMGVKGIEHNKFAGHVPGSKQQNVYVHLDNKDMKRTVMEKVYGKRTQHEEPQIQRTSFHDITEPSPTNTLSAGFQGNKQQQSHEVTGVNILQLQQQIMMLQQQLQATLSQQSLTNVPSRIENPNSLPKSVQYY